MSVDYAVNERLNGLVTLLKAVGVDENARGSRTGDPALDMARQLNDDQIEAIIRKLQQAQTAAPEIIASLEAHAEARSLAGGGKGGHDDDDEDVLEEEVEEEVVEEQEDDEDDDDFDEDANYPMVGHGVSDDISVISDLTTPTVVGSNNVPEEEHYRETLPPMIVGGVGEPSMIISAPKRKNLVAPVRPPPIGTLAPPGSRRNVTPGYAHHQHHATAGTGGGAAAARRKMYLDTMAKLHENPNGMGYVGPAAAPTSAQITHKLKVTTAAAPTSTKIRSDGSAHKPSKSKSSKPSSSKTKTSSKEQDWNTFEDPASGKSSKPRSDKSGAGGPTVIDDAGFLVDETGFDPFSSGSNPFKSSAGDLEFGSGNKMASSQNSGSGGFDAFGMAPHGTNSSVGGEKSKQRKSSKSGSSKKTSSSGDRDRGDADPTRKSSRSGATSGRGSSGRRVSRRASAV